MSSKPDREHATVATPRPRSLRLGAAVIALVLVIGTMLAGQVFGQDATPMTEQPVAIAGSELTWTGDWTYMVGSSDSIQEQVTFSQTDLEAQVLKVVTYGVLVPGVGPDAAAAIEAFATTYLEEGGATDINQVRTGQLDDGTVWAVYTGNASESAGANTFGEAGLAALITVRAVDTGFVATSLTTNGPLLRDAITQVQGEFVLDGAGPLFAGIDAAAVTADLPTENILVTGAEPGATPEATPLGTPEITVATSAAATPPGSPEAELVASPGATPLSGSEATLAAIQDGESTPESTPAP